MFCIYIVMNLLAPVNDSFSGCVMPDGVYPYNICPENFLKGYQYRLSASLHVASVTIDYYSYLVFIFSQPDICVRAGNISGYVSPYLERKDLQLILTEAYSQIRQSRSGVSNTSKITRSFGGGIIFSKE